MEGEFSLKRRLGHHCPKLHQLHVPLNTHVVRNAVWSHFERFTCHAEDEIVSRTHCWMGNENSVPVLTCQFSRDGLGGHLLATGDEQGQVLLMDTRKRAKQSVIEEITAHHNAIHEVCWNRNGSELVTASADNTLKLWDINCLCKELSTLRGHQGTVKSVDVHRDEPTIIVSGGRDGIVAVWDTRYNNRGTHHSPLRISQYHSPQAVVRMRLRSFVKKEATTRHSVSAVRFLGDHGILTSGIDGIIKFWDKRSLSEVCHTFEAPVKLGITAIALDSSHTQIFASCKDSKIYAFDCMTFQKSPVAQYSGHKVSSYYIKLALSPDDRYLLSGSANMGMFFNGGGHIWEVNNKEGADYDMRPLVMLPGQDGEVTGVAWCPSELSKIVTCSDNHDTWIWRTSNDSSEDKIIAHCDQYSVRGCLRVRPPKTPSPVSSSPSNCSQQSAEGKEDKAMTKNKDQTNSMSSEVTTPVTSPLMRCNNSCTTGSSGSESRKRRIPLDCITNNNSISLSLTPKRKAIVKRTKQVTLDVLMQKERK